MIIDLDQQRNALIDFGLSYPSLCIGWSLWVYILYTSIGSDIIIDAQFAQQHYIRIGQEINRRVQSCNSVAGQRVKSTQLFQTGVPFEFYWIFVGQIYLVYTRLIADRMDCIDTHFELLCRHPFKWVSDVDLRHWFTQQLQTFRCVRTGW